MTKRHRVLLAGAIVITGLLVAALGFVRWSNRTETADRAPAPGLARVAALESASYLLPEGPADVNAAVQRVGVALRARDHSGRSNLSPQAAEALIRVAEHRLRMYLDPDYDRYLAHVSALTGEPESALRESGRLMERDEWERAADDLARAQLAPDSATIRPVFLGGASVEQEMIGHMTYRRDATGIYSDALRPDPARTPIDVYEIEIPVRIPDPFRAEKRVEVYFVMRLFRDAQSTKWLPWQSGYADPSDELRLGAPWL